MNNPMIKNGLLLALFALLCTGLVAVVNQQTFDKIKLQQQKELMGILHQLIPEEIHDNELTAQCTLLQNKEALGTEDAMPAYIATAAGKPVAIAMEAIAPDGYNGNIKLIVGINTQGEVLGVRTLAHQETPGLGDKIELRKSDWVTKFVGKVLKSEDDKQWQVQKDGGDFDQFTGATITPRAYVKAVKRAVWYFTQHQAEIFSQPLNCEAKHD
ncbi:electron transport complex subunit RsxG [Shewanella oneidensis MR-1]|uniref:Ion-translocating oxidoreductase complex subunit G n=1 Tax=Shewanella oneidensis (strain ATCC 700550 / JCM 31522 / CIP 106686 / LMG 19005 / NCIMB 14063 / MR-1) TaxID=211586 RepID=RNFG_SHEON|nr:electron transport complex subunit RsxG [Shewanella oneidensis]Q8EE77.1 RecName: Full=Ion-translocating oxidoreductase complex subunit G; AltName: Full=Rnf electron transport complex subunit G [Shewanella oneidensis MR-1]AAN55543.1 ion (H+ or Na+)-translocating NADH:ferredoxin oxidoreductase subunit RnfG [Shewanella oneidensis MR-1]MDX5995806.1 electron transport complex subunit RsxG [Shewanella oneidensis]MEE2029476.1 Ion-translocating oxidoreductase complex subunit G [Shewanella oneidensis